MATYHFDLQAHQPHGMQPAYICPQAAGSQTRVRANSWPLAATAMPLASQNNPMAPSCCCCIVADACRILLLLLDPVPAAAAVGVQQVLDAAADDLVTPEYLMVPGSGYGQALPGPVVGGTGPPVMLSSITPEGIVTTNTLQQGTQQPAAAGPAAPGGGGGGGGGGGSSRARASGAKGPRRPHAAQSKIKEAVAASRRNATAQQQSRQQLLASAIAGGSSLFGAAGAGPYAQQQAQRSSSTAAEAAAACASAAAAEQFLSNPWTSCFLAPSALPADVCGFTELPSADISADDEARLGALGAEGAQLPELQPPDAPAAYAVLKRVLAGQEGGAAAEGSSSSLRVGPQSQLQAAGLAPTSGAEAYMEQEDQQQQQQLLLLREGRQNTQDKGAAAGLHAAAAGATRSRGVFADITAGLNNQPGTIQGPGSWPAAAAPSSEELARAVAWAQGLGVSAEDSQQSLTSADDWRDLPLVDDSAELQQQQQERRQAWACDFGHLEGVEAPGPKTSARQRRAAGKPHKRWSETWVGDFGHLQEFPRWVQQLGPGPAASIHCTCRHAFPKFTCNTNVVLVQQATQCGRLRVPFNCMADFWACAASTRAIDISNIHHAHHPVGPAMLATAGLPMRLPSSSSSRRLLVVQVLQMGLVRHLGPAASCSCHLQTCRH
jgi:hypothetical protein